MPTSAHSPDSRAARALAEQLETQARACASLGSPLYAGLLHRAAGDAVAGGPVWRLLASHAAEGRGGALALRFMAAAHRLVLTGAAPDLARHYPSAGGDGDVANAWQALRALIAGAREQLSPLVSRPCQTNEVGRCAPLAGGFLAVASRAGLPLRLLEVGASAGLNLRWDQFRYGGGGVEWGDPASPVDLRGLWQAPPPHLGARVEVAQRQGCDPAPIDPFSVEGRLALAASVWADQVDRLERLGGAIRVAAQVPASVDESSLADWLPQRLEEPLPGAATVVYHSVVEEYLDAATGRLLRSALHDAGEAATVEAPLAWLRLEPSSELRQHALTLTMWPTGAQETLAFSGAHGTAVRWAVVA